MLFTKPQIQAKIDKAGFKHPVKIVRERQGFHVLLTEAELPIFIEKIQNSFNVVWRKTPTMLQHQPTGTNYVEMRFQ